MTNCYICGTDPCCCLSEQELEELSFLESIHDKITEANKSK